MSALYPPCPHLPEADPSLDWRSLAAHRDNQGSAFYLAALRYGQCLWQRTLPARAILCLDRAMGADVSGEEPELQAWPMPYAAMAWFLAHAPEGVFIGNPRVHFQHYADRLSEPRKAVRSARAWACWAIARAVRPEWPGDPRHSVVEPSLSEIRAALEREGYAGEVAFWETALARAQ